MSVIGQNIRFLRLQKGWSQQQFAAHFKLSRAAIGSYEENRAEPKLSVIIDICAYFNEALGDFLQIDLASKVKQEVVEESSANQRNESVEDRLERIESKIDRLLKNQSDE